MQAEKQTEKPTEKITEDTTLKSKEIISRSKLLEAGVHFGHKKSLWNPKMAPFFLKKINNDRAPGKRNIHLIDITKTKKALEFAYSLIEKLTLKNASFIFVGTRNVAKETIQHNARRTNSFYVSERWLGGTLTNWKTISQNVKRMMRLEKMAQNNFEGYTKKEGLGFAKDLKKLQRNLSGIRNMLYTKPNIMIVADPKHDNIAVKEARKTGVKIIGIVDSNSDPTLVDVAIPANDDSIKAVTLIITILADAIAKAKGSKQEFAYQDDENIVLPDEKRHYVSDEARTKHRSSNLKPTFSRVKFEKSTNETTKSEKVATPEKTTINETKLSEEKKPQEATLHQEVKKEVKSDDTNE